MDLLDPFSCQLHNIAFDKLKSHTPLPCQGTQSINIPLKFHCISFIYISIYLSAHSFGFTNEHLLDTLYVQRVFVGYIFIIRYTLLGIGFDDKDY